MPDEFLYPDLLGYSALYSCLRDVSVPEGLYRYYLGDPNGYDCPGTISKTPCAAHGGTVLLWEPLNLNEVRDITFGFYEDVHGNPLTITVREYLDGMEPAVLQTESGTDDELCL